jgi:o-succinylbenzoate synthase
MRASFRFVNLEFKRKAQTSRNLFSTRKIAVLELLSENNEAIAQAEIAPIEGLSAETWKEVEQELKRIISVSDVYTWNSNLSSVQFAIDTILAQLNRADIHSPFISAEHEFPILLNGLVWMNDIPTMWTEACEAQAMGYSAVKFKIGSLSWREELNLLEKFRKNYPQVEIRVDANGAFSLRDARNKLNDLFEFEIHSVEQPIAQNNWKEMAELCVNSTVPIAFDEELILWNDEASKFFECNGLPQFLVLKPSLHGGFKRCEQHAQWAQSNNVKWWVTSYLESNIGLNHIANWVCSKSWKMRHGLGTGKLFNANFEELWKVKNGYLISSKNDPN